MLKNLCILTLSLLVFSLSAMNKQHEELPDLSDRSIPELMLLIAHTENTLRQVNPSIVAWVEKNPKFANFSQGVERLQRNLTLARQELDRKKAAAMHSKK